MLDNMLAPNNAEQGPIDPYLLYTKLAMVKLDNALAQGLKADIDDFEYFTLIGQGSHCASMVASPASSPQMKPRRRSKSVKHSRREKGQDSTDEEIRPRTNSMPTKDKSVTYYRVRNFSTSGNSLQNKGDTYRSSRGSGSEISIASSQGSDNTHRVLSPKYSTGDESGYSESVCADCTYKILVMGAESVGKTALTRQFFQSDDIEYDDDVLEIPRESTISIALDGEESSLTFMDSDYDYDNYDPSSADAYIVVYSITDRETFDEAKGILKNLRHFEKTKAMFLCGNKSDLARSRVIANEEGKRLASEYTAKFIETSTMLNHKVDELLVGMLSQIKLEEKRCSKKSTSGSLRQSIKGLVNTIIRSQNSSVKHRKQQH